MAKQVVKATITKTMVNPKTGIKSVGKTTPMKSKTISEKSFYSDSKQAGATKRIVNQAKSLDSGRAAVIKQFDRAKSKDGSYPKAALDKFKKSTDSLRSVSVKVFGKKK